MYYCRRKSKGKGEEEGYKEGKPVLSSKEEGEYTYLNLNGKGNDREGKGEAFRNGKGGMGKTG